MKLTHNQVTQLQSILDHVAVMYEDCPNECSVEIKTDCTNTNIFIEVPGEFSSDIFNGIGVMHTYDEINNITKCILLK
jgi:hypothetical protein